MPTKEILPFISINVYVEREYLEKVARYILEGVGKLTKEEQIAFSQNFRKYVNVLGFRNPLRAPLSLQVNAYASAFEEKEEVIPFTLTTWAKLSNELAEKVHSWLKSEGWEDLALARDFEEDHGFIADWPDDLTFDQIEKQFSDTHPNFEHDRDDLILMVLWIAGRLPKE
ncbi:MAG: hypothetical protein K0B06_00965 [Brevefilum sp.]|nr:hypothetical protein [Brevefilum sp.]